MSTQSVRINTDILNRVRKQIKKSGHTLAGFIGATLDYQLYRLEGGEIKTVEERKRKRPSKQFKKEFL